MSTSRLVRGRGEARIRSCTVDPSHGLDGSNLGVIRSEFPSFPDVNKYHMAVGTASNYLLKWGERMASSGPAPKSPLSPHVYIP